MNIDNGLYLNNIISFNNTNLKNDSFESMLINYKEYVKQNSDNVEEDDEGRCKINITYIIQFV